jgi:hypothetical protein
MDTKTAKSEALELLAQDYETLSYEQRDRLQLLTALQVGYTMQTGIVTQGNTHARRGMGLQGLLFRGKPLAFNTCTVVY